MTKNKFRKRSGFIMIMLLLTASFSFSQASLQGRTFATLFNTACKDASDGGCTIYTYCTLKFQKKTVKVIFSSRANCASREKEKAYEKNTTEKTCQWYWDKKTIRFKGCWDFGSLTFSDDKLVGKKFASDKANTIEFTEAINN